MRVVLITDTDLVPWVKVKVTRELVVSPRVTEVLPIATVVFPKLAVVLLQETEDLPQEMAYLVFRIETLPLVKEVLLDKYAVFHSSAESFFDGFAGLDALALASGVLSI